MGEPRLGRGVRQGWLFQAPGCLARGSSSSPSGLGSTGALPPGSGGTLRCLRAQSRPGGHGELSPVQDKPLAPVTPGCLVTSHHPPHALQAGLGPDPPDACQMPPLSGPRAGRPPAGLSVLIPRVSTAPEAPVALCGLPRGPESHRWACRPLGTPHKPLGPVAARVLIQRDPEAGSSGSHLSLDQVLTAEPSLCSIHRRRINWCAVNLFSLKRDFHTGENF